MALLVRMRRQYSRGNLVTSGFQKFPEHTAFMASPDLLRTPDCSSVAATLSPGGLTGLHDADCLEHRGNLRGHLCDLADHPGCPVVDEHACVAKTTSRLQPGEELPPATRAFPLDSCTRVCRSISCYIIHVVLSSYCMDFTEL